MTEMLDQWESLESRRIEGQKFMLYKITHNLSVLSPRAIPVKTKSLSTIAAEARKLVHFKQELFSVFSHRLSRTPISQSTIVGGEGC